MIFYLLTLDQQLQKKSLSADYPRTAPRQNHQRGNAHAVI
jgi:predicted transcriptional regulator